MTNALFRAAVATAASAVLAAALAACGGAPDRSVAPRSAAAAASVGASPASVAPSAAGQRGALLSVQPLQRWDAAQARAFLTSQGVDASRVRFGVDASRIGYATVDPTGRPTTASALVTQPTAVPGWADERRMVSWQHGTIPARDEVGSMTADGSDRAAAVLFAADGYVVSAPDYLGLGTGPGFHPYLDLPSTVTASIDSVRATRAYVERAPNPVRLDGQVLVSGHSQGGQAAMAVGAQLQRGGDPAFRLAAVGPIAVPYDVTTTLHTAVTTGIANASAYLAYFTVEWNRLHHLYSSPAEAFRPPYDRTVPTMLDGNHSSQDILAVLPPTPAQLFTSDFLAGLTHPTGPLAEALQVADSSCDWRPSVPVRLYAASGDRDVPIANSRYCQRRVSAAGGAAELVDVGDVDHSTSELRALPQILAGFDQLGGPRQGG
ncbi:MAG TPA: lipase [Pseudonocardia sp.]|nr:lipase [Pseudonocardia sp.]